MRPRHVIIMLEDLFAKQTGSLRRNGTKLSASDSQTVQEVYQQWLLLLLDLGYLPHDELKREWGRMVKYMYNTDIMTLLNASANCLQMVYRQFPDGAKGFEALCRDISPNLYNLIKLDVQRIIHEDDVVAAKRLIQLFAYPTRLTLRQVDLVDECLNDYKSIEDAFDDYYPKGLITSLNAIMRRWLADLDLQRLSYRHGNGSTAGSIGVLEHKYKSLSSDKYLEIVYKDDFLPSSGMWDLPGVSNPFSPFHCKLERISHTTFVPKSYKTFRTISMEPATLMFIQQGIWRRLDNYVENHNYLRHRIGFHDQQRNRSLAAEGSLGRNYCTVDLSAASDSVSWRLVKGVFDKTPLMKHLIATRSKQTLLPNGELLDLKKFAPMGSAMCFPVETLIFAACCEYVTREHGLYRKFSVFGDDIIVPTQCYDDLNHVLTILGFKVNQDKSFFEPEIWFRESCGGEYCDGYDVTPLRVSRKYYSVLDNVALTGLIDTANEAHKRGFRYLRSFFIGKLSTRRDFVPFFSETSILSDNFTNYHTQRRWNEDLQYIECRVSGTHTEADLRNEHIAYFHRLILNNEEPSINEDSPWSDYDVIPSWDDEASATETSQLTVKSKKDWVVKPFEEGDQLMIDFFRIYDDELTTRPEPRIGTLV